VQQIKLAARQLSGARKHGASYINRTVVSCAQRNQGLFGTVISAFSRAPYSRHNSVVAASKLSPSNSVTPDGGHRSPVALTPSPPSDTGGARSPSPRLLSPHGRSQSFLSVDYVATSPTPPPLAAASCSAAAQLSPSNSLLLSSTDNSRRTSRQR